MITLETGLPGSGKTTYCVEKLLMPLVGKTYVGVNGQGEKVEYERRIYTNINVLLLDHEPIGEEELNTWHEWAQPGALIVFDEVQKPWPLKATGSAVPACIQKLETHRHMGVDFILLTQHPMLIHSNVVRLVGRHLHIRRLGNTKLATVYEWDSCSRTLLYKNSFAKSAWRMSAKAHANFKSSDLHTKQPRRVPTVLYTIVFALIGFAVLAYQNKQSLSERFSGKNIVVAEKQESAKPGHVGSSSPSSSASPSAEKRLIDDRVDWVPRISTRPESAPAFDGLRKVSVMPVVAGAVCNSSGCRCVTQQGTIAGLSDDECRAWLASPPFDAYGASKPERAPPSPSHQESSSESAAGPSLVVFDGGGRYDPQGYKTR